MIRKSFDAVVVTAHPSSNGIEEDFRLTRDSHSNCIYTKVGERNVDEYVNSFKNGCSLKSILERCSLMPVRDKIAYLQQANGSSVDVSAMPKDLTAAFIQYRDFAESNPDIVKRYRGGESADSIIKSILAADSAKQDHKQEVSNNGKNESGNE